MNTPFRILVVDDEVAVIDSYKTILEKPAGRSSDLSALEDELFGPGAEQIARVQGPEFRLDTCRQGEKAVAEVSCAQKANRPYSVIFMDARMPPGIDGITAAQAIREIDPYVIIVLVTAYSDIDLSGIVGGKIPAMRFLYLAKPFQPQEIVRLATALSLQWDAERAHRAELECKNDALSRMLEEETWLRKAADSAQRAKIALFANVGHELRTPLNSVIGFSQLMLDGVNGSIANPAYHGYIGEIHAAGENLLDAINAILAVAEVESGMLRARRSDTDLADALALAVKETAGFARGRDVALVFTPSPRACRFHADPEQLGRALYCLVHNAIKFSPPGGTVAIDLIAKPDRLEVRISDEGCGMVDGDLQTLLKPFEQAESHFARRYDGLGLGMTLAKGLLELQGGCLTVQSTPGRGTTIVIHFLVDTVVSIQPLCA